MKKRIAVLLAVIMMLSFTACKKETTETVTSIPPVSSEPVVSEPEPASQVSSEVSSKAKPKTPKKSNKKPVAKQNYGDNIKNIALFGLDTRKATGNGAFKGRSDSIMILSLDKTAHTVSVVSVVRDSLVPIPGHGYGKINAAYAYGGSSRAIQTLNEAFGLNIEDYAAVNFFGMAEIIDAVGGVDVTLTANEVQSAKSNEYCINGTISEICKILGKKASKYAVTKSGKQHLNGIQAVGYCRIRHVKNCWGTTGDYGRTERQRFVMEQLCQKVVSMDPAEYPALVKKLLKNVKTSLSVTEILELANEILTQSPTFYKENIPCIKSGKNMKISSPTSRYGSVEYYDIDFAAKLIHAFLNDHVSFADYISKNGIGKNNWYAKGLH